MPNPNVFLNGRMIPASEASLNIYDLGVVLGATVTEMVRTFHQRLYRLDGHLSRLARSLEYVHFPLSINLAELADAATALVEHNARLVPPWQELALVIFLTAGESRVYARGAGRPARLEPTVCAHTFPLPYADWVERLRHGAHLVTPRTRNLPAACVDPNVKHRSRLHYYLADREARLVDPQAVPLLLDLDGYVTETNTANFLMVRQRTLVSPPVERVLPGISRDVVAELAAKLGIPMEERPIAPDDVAAADEALLTSTPYCLMSAVRINGRPIGQGQPGPVFRRLMEAWNAEVGLDIVKQIEDGARLASQS
ncbi:MAG: aminotransferase class IV [Pirellulales bacterium]|nr:aminotransferase class IV [Pirellulales bacterium]